MEYIDLTHKIKNELSEYPGDPKTKLNYFKKADETDSSTLLKLETGLHTGTHMDSPFHYIINGKKISQLPLKNFIGKASINYVESKSKEILVKNCNLKNSKEKIAIIITGWSKYFGSDKYFYENPYLSDELTELIIEKNFKGIAIDTCSVDKYGKDREKETTSDYVCRDLFGCGKKYPEYGFLPYFQTRRLSAGAF